MRKYIGKSFAFITFTAAIAVHGQARAASFNVNNLGDGNTPKDGKCTLREALNAANTNTKSDDCQGKTGSVGWDTINTPSGTVTLGSTLTINDDVGIFSGGTNTTLIGPSNLIAIRVSSNRYGELKGITIQGGSGPALWADPNGSASLYTCTIRDKTFSIGGGQSGGVVSSDGSYVFLQGTTVVRSKGSIKGAAVFSNTGGGIGVEYSTFEDNQASQYGGAIHNQGFLNCFNSTISNNQADIVGGGISNSQSGSSEIYNCTITRNKGGGIKIHGGSVRMQTSILADQQTGSNCVGTMTSGGSNVVGSMSNCTMASNNDQLNVSSANLGVIGPNGGPTRTHLPNVGSPVLGATSICPFDDQRFIVRTAVPCDVGSVER